MIQANELRLGSRVCERGNHRIYAVRGISNYGVTLKYWSCGECEIIPYNRLMPVPLTLEILEGLGFNETFGGFCQGPEKFNIDYSPTNKTFKIGGNSKTLYLEYLHQLQNAFFLNTGKELFFKALQTKEDL